MSNKVVLTFEIIDRETGKVEKVFINREEWWKQEEFFKSKQFRPKLQGEGLMFHPDRSHETPELKQAVINAVKGINIEQKLNTHKMKNPKELQIFKNKEGQLSSILLPTYVLGSEGMRDTNGLMLNFCKGTKETPEEERQSGVFTESLIQASLEYLQDVNVGPLQNIDTTEAIQHLKAALGCLDRRQQKRINNGTIYTKK